jgi:hypothetical protein
VSGTVAVPLLLIGALTLLGTLESMLVAPLMQRIPVPVCCRRRVEIFESRARWIAFTAAATTLTGAILLLF